MYEGGDGKNCKTFPRIPDEPSKPQNFSPSKLSAEWPQYEINFTIVDATPYRVFANFNVKKA